MTKHIHEQGLGVKPSPQLTVEVSQNPFSSPSSAPIESHNGSHKKHKQDKENKQDKKASHASPHVASTNDQRSSANREERDVASHHEGLNKHERLEGMKGTAADTSDSGISGISGGAAGNFGEETSRASLAHKGNDASSQPQSPKIPQPMNLPKRPQSSKGLRWSWLLIWVGMLGLAWFRPWGETIDRYLATTIAPVLQQTVGVSPWLADNQKINSDRALLERLSDRTQAVEAGLATLSSSVQQWSTVEQRLTALESQTRVSPDGDHRDARQDAQWEELNQRVQQIEVGLARLDGLGVLERRLDELSLKLVREDGALSGDDVAGALDQGMRSLLIGNALLTIRSRVMEGQPYDHMVALIKSWAVRSDEMTALLTRADWRTLERGDVGVSSISVLRTTLDDAIEQYNNKVAQGVSLGSIASTEPSPTSGLGNSGGSGDAGGLGRPQTFELSDEKALSYATTSDATTGLPLTGLPLTSTQNISQNTSESASVLSDGNSTPSAPLALGSDVGSDQAWIGFLQDWGVVVVSKAREVASALVLWVGRSWDWLSPRIWNWLKDLGEVRVTHLSKTSDQRELLLIAAQQAMQRQDVHAAVLAIQTFLNEQPKDAQGVSVRPHQDLQHLQRWLEAARLRLEVLEALTTLEYAWSIQQNSLQGLSLAEEQVRE